MSKWPGVIAFSIGMIALGGYSFVSCNATTKLECDRVGEPKCILTRDGMFSKEVQTFSGDRLKGAETITHRGKGHDTYAVAIIDRQGASTEVIDRVDESDGPRVAAWITDRRQATVSVVHEREIAQLVVAVLGILVGIAAPFLARLKPAKA